MKIQINKKYSFRIDVAGKILNYTGEVLSVDGHFVTFKDKFGIILSYNLNNIVSYEEIEK